MRRTILAALAILIAGTSASLAVEKLKVAIPQKGFWDSSWVEFGEAAGFFKDAGLEVEVFYTEGGAQTIATVASGSVDIAMSNGILGAIGAYVKGGEATPYRIISAEMTGANELFWWVKADSPIKSLKDADGKTIAFSSPGSSSNLILLTLLKQTGSKAKPVPTGGVPGTYTQTMTGQIDIGWSVVPFALKDVNEGKIRIVARSREATELAEPDHPRQPRQRQFAQDQARGDHQVHAGDPEVDRLGLHQSAGDRDLRQEHEGHARDRQAGGGRVLPEVGRCRSARSGTSTVRCRTRSTSSSSPSPKTPQDIAGLFDIVYKPK